MDLWFECFRFFRSFLSSNFVVVVVVVRFLFVCCLLLSGLEFFSSIGGDLKRNRNWNTGLLQGFCLSLSFVVLL